MRLIAMVTAALLALSLSFSANAQIGGGTENQIGKQGTSQKGPAKPTGQYNPKELGVDQAVPVAKDRGKAGSSKR